jgi:hypothetical protein
LPKETRGGISPDLGLRACSDNEVPLIRNTGIRRVDAERGRQRDQMILLVDQDGAQAFGDRVFFLQLAKLSLRSRLAFIAYFL